jgi:nucleoside recognition membrane protein YjiH
LFLFGAVAVAMFRSPALGGALAFGHYAGGLAVGLLFRFHARGERPSDPPSGTGSAAVLPLPARAVRAALRARERDGRPLVRVMNDAIVDSARTLLVIASFIVLFSVLLRVLGKAHALGALAWPVGLVLRAFGLPPSLTGAAVAGLFEIDLGCAAAAAAHAPLVARLALAGAIIAWSGLSVHAQVLSVLAGTDIRLGPYYVARLLHAVLAGGLTALALGPAAPALRLGERLTGVAPVLAGVPAHPSFWSALGAGGEMAVVAALIPLAAVVLHLGWSGIGGVRFLAWRVGRRG